MVLLTLITHIVISDVRRFVFFVIHARNNRTVTELVQICQTESHVLLITTVVAISFVNKNSVISSRYLR